MKLKRLKMLSTKCECCGHMRKTGTWFDKRQVYICAACIRFAERFWSINPDLMHVFDELPYAR